MLKKSNFLFKLILLSIFIFTITINISFTEQIKYLEEAEKLKVLGLLSGSDKGFELDRQTTRCEAAVMVVRLLGKENEAIRKDYNHHFLDVPKWASPYIGYMYKNGLVNGITKYKYGSQENIDAKSYITFVLRVLGYRDNGVDFTWSDALEFACEKELISVKEKIDLKSKTFLRDDFINISFSALSTKKKNSKDTIGDILLSEGIINYYIALKTNLIDCYGNIIKPYKTSIQLKLIVKEENGVTKYYLDYGGLEALYNEIYSITTTSNYLNDHPYGELELIEELKKVSGHSDITLPYPMSKWDERLVKQKYGFESINKYTYVFFHNQKYKVKYYSEIPMNLNEGTYYFEVKQAPEFTTYLEDEVIDNNYLEEIIKNINIEVDNDNARVQVIITNNGKEKKIITRLSPMGDVLNQVYYNKTFYYNSPRSDNVIVKASKDNRIISSLKENLEDKILLPYSEVEKLDNIYNYDPNLIIVNYFFDENINANYYYEVPKGLDEGVYYFDIQSIPN